MNLFEIAILEVPTKKQMEDEGKKARIVVEPTCILAKDEQTALMRLAKDGKIPSDADEDRLNVLIRPFA